MIRGIFIIMTLLSKRHNPIWVKKCFALRCRHVLLPNGREPRRKRAKSVLPGGPKIPMGGSFVSRKFLMAKISCRYFYQRHSFACSSRLEKNLTDTLTQKTNLIHLRNARCFASTFKKQRKNFFHASHAAIRNQASLSLNKKKKI